MLLSDFSYLLCLVLLCFILFLCASVVTQFPHRDLMLSLPTSRTHPTMIPLISHGEREGEPRKKRFT